MSGTGVISSTGATEKTPWYRVDIGNGTTYLYIQYLGQSGYQVPELGPYLDQGDNQIQGFTDKMLK